MIDEGSGPVTPPPSEPPPEEIPQPEPLLPRLFAALRRARTPGGKSWWRNRWVQGTVLVVVLAALVTIGLQGVARVRETEVGVEVNNFTGDLILAERVGYHIFLPGLRKFYVLDRTIQRLDLGWRQGLGAGGRDLKLKASDGSSVSLDVVINYKLIPGKAVEVLRRSGPDRRFTEIWIEPFARHICLNSFGQLTTEEMYDAAKRDERARAAQSELNTKLGPYGIEVVAVIPGEFRFYEEYEKVIHDKKLADQEVEEQQAEFRAAKEDQTRQLVEANKQAQTRLAAFDGECQNRLIEAKAMADKTKREADGAYAATLLKADAAFYTATKQALGQKATLLAQAEGMEQMRKAMVGDGGLSMIGMEYAKHLAQIRFSATPITRDPSIQQFAVHPEAAAASGSEQVKPLASPADQTATPADRPGSGPVMVMPGPQLPQPQPPPAQPQPSTAQPPGGPGPRANPHPEIDTSKLIRPTQRPSDGGNK